MVYKGPVFTTSWGLQTTPPPHDFENPHVLYTLNTTWKLNRSRSKNAFNLPVTFASTLDMNSSFLSHSEHLESIAEDTASIPASSNVILDADLNLPPIPGPSQHVGGTSGCTPSQGFSWNDITTIREDPTFASSEIEAAFLQLGTSVPQVCSQVYHHNGD